MSEGNGDGFPLPGVRHSLCSRQVRGDDFVIITAFDDRGIAIHFKVTLGAGAGASETYMQCSRNGIIPARPI